ncbi:MAG TPA: hypothetical protein VGB85_17260 [Nannocystis sp.]
MTKQIKIVLAALSLTMIAGACSGGAAGGNSLCEKAAAPLSGIVLLEVKDAGDDPAILKTFKAELAAECTAQKTEETAKDALECYDKNASALGYRIFKTCPEQPGKALIAAVVAKHGAK